jgi:hypothetical protein
MNTQRIKKLMDRIRSQAEAFGSNADEAVAVFLMVTLNTMSNVNPNRTWMVSEIARLWN